MTSQLFNTNNTNYNNFLNVNSTVSSNFNNLQNNMMMNSFDNLNIEPHSGSKNGSNINTPNLQKSNNISILNNSSYDMGSEKIPTVDSLNNN